MSCLTRKLQQNIARYLKRHRELTHCQNPEKVKGELVDRGLCPSDVTRDQIKSILEQIRT